MKTIIALILALATSVSFAGNLDDIEVLTSERSKCTRIEVGTSKIASDLFTGIGFCKGEYAPVLIITYGGKARVELFDGVVNSYVEGSFTHGDYLYKYQVLSVTMNGQYMLQTVSRLMLHEYNTLSVAYQHKGPIVRSPYFRSSILDDYSVQVYSANGDGTEAMWRITPIINPNFVASVMQQEQLDRLNKRNQKSSTKYH